MIKHVGDEKLSALFSDGRKYKIPKYQRAYTWGKKEWGQLFEDITENDNGYFLGSIICVNDTTKDAAEYELIDGQQRLTTISLLLLAICSKLAEYRSSFDADLKTLTKFVNITNELYEEVGGKEIPRIELQTTGSNRDDYESLLIENKIIVGQRAKPKFRGLRYIEKAFRFFQKSLLEYLAENPKQKPFECLFRIAEKLNSAVLVAIEVDSHKDAYMLFESLNNRGVPLSAIDLIKNILIRESEVDKATDETHAKWEMILENLGDDCGDRERFFRQYYNAFRDEINEPYKNNSTKMYELGYLATRTTILDIYERLVKDKGYKDFVDDVLKYSELYSIITCNSSDEKVYSEGLKDLLNIQGAPSYLLLLYLMDKKGELAIDDKQIAEVVKFLVKFFVRRNITDTPNTRHLTRIFMEVIAEIRGRHGDDVIAAIKAKLIGCSASNAAFEEKLRGPIYVENDMATRFILCYIESQHQTKEIYSDLWKRDASNKFIWTIEHIFPEGDNIPNEWVQMIAEGDKAVAKDCLEKYAHTIGNLTLTGYNQNLSNLSFDKKMNRMKDGKSVGYKNGLYLNEDVQSQKEWKVKNITDRTERLVGIAVSLFALD